MTANPAVHHHQLLATVGENAAGLKMMVQDAQVFKNHARCSALAAIDDGALQPQCIPNGIPHQECFLK